MIVGNPLKPPPPQSSDLDVAAKTAVKKVIGQELNFQQEKANILAAMGASPSMLLTPNANDNIRRKIDSSVVSIGRPVDSYDTRYNNNNNNNNPPQEEPDSRPFLSSQTTATVTCDGTEEPPLDATVTYYDDIEEPSLEGLHNNYQSDSVTLIKRFSVIAFTFLLLFAIAITISGITMTVNNGQDKQNLPSSVSSLCTMNREICQTGSSLFRASSFIDTTDYVPSCAKEQYRMLQLLYHDDDTTTFGPCDSSHLAFLALAVAKTNYPDRLLRREDLDLFFATASLYFSTNGESWNIRDNWLEGVSPCTNNWYGVTCNNGDNNSTTTSDDMEEKHTDGLTIKIEMTSNNIGGSLPTIIGILTSLRVLRLGKNSIGGTIPSEVGLLTNLETLIIDGTAVEGQIPEEIGSIKALKDLILEDNSLTGTLPELPTSLERLYLTGDDLVGKIFHKIKNLRNLRFIRFSRFYSNSGSVNPLIFHHFPNLEELKLDHVTIDPSPFPMIPVINGGLNSTSKLRLLYFAFSEITGSIPIEIGALHSSLKTLSLTLDVGKNGEIPSSIGSLTKLENLVLSGDWRGNIPSDFGKLTELNYLALRGGIGGTIPTELGELSLLKDTDLSDNRLTGSIPPELCTLAQLTSFEYDSCDEKRSIKISANCLPNSC